MSVAHPLRAPSTVVDVEVTDLPARLTGLDRFVDVLVVVWHAGAPVSRIVLPVSQGAVEGTVLREAVYRTAAAAVALERARARLATAAGKPAPRAPVTVAVCTRDRPTDLDRCLGALTAVIAPLDEIVVVDSASADPETRRTVERHPRARYVRESKAGLDVARNRALREATHHIVAFCDDDAVVDPGWVDALAAPFRDPRTLCVTGLTLPLELETEAQVCFENTLGFGRGFAERRFDGAVVDPFLVGRIGAGANMALRRSVAVLVGEFDEALDAGTATRSGGDHDMFTRILAAGYCIVYAPTAVNRHRHRRQWSELVQTVRGYGTGVYAHLTKHLVEGHEPRTLAIVVGWGRSQIRQLFRGLVGRPGAPPARLGLSELAGCVAGPGAFRTARRQAPPPRRLRDEDGGRDVGPSVDTSGPSRLPRVSVVIPTHARVESLERLLRLLARTGHTSPCEVVVVADGGADEVAPLLDRSPWPFPVRVIDQRPGCGAAGARNRGAALATGDVLLFIDDDIEPFGDVVGHHAREQLNGAEVVIGAARVPRPVEIGYRGLAGWAWWEQQFERMREPTHRFGFDDVFTGVLSLRASLWQRIGGFDDTLRCREDFELGLRLVRTRARFAFTEAGGGWHHDNRIGARLLQRKRAEGVADVEVARRHPWAWGALRPGAREARGADLVRALAFTLPGDGRWMEAVGERMLDGLERMKMRGYWRRLHSALVYHAYCRGVRSALGRDESLQSFEAAARASLPPGHRVGTLDLAGGAEAVRAQVDDERPDRVHLRFGTLLLGVIEDRPGREALRGRHLSAMPRPLLGAYASACALHELGAPDDLGVAPDGAGRWLVTGPHGPAAWIAPERAPAVAPPAPEWTRALEEALPDLSAAALRSASGSRRVGGADPVSVVICTRDRPESLAACLDSIARLDHPDHEVIVVDNAPTSDATRRVAERHAVRYVVEPQPGLDRARNRGIACARHPLVAFTDDDVRVDPGWVTALVSAFADPRVGLVTGLVAPASLRTEAERIFELDYGGMGKGFAPRLLDPAGADPARLLDTHHLGVGANMAVRRDVLDAVGGFDPALDVGTPAHGGGDLDLFHRVLLNGYCARYEPAALVWHRHRADRSALRAQLYDNGRAFGVYLLTRLREGRLPRSVVLAHGARWLAWLLGRVPRRFLRRERLPLPLVLAEIWGASHAPWAWLRARGQARRLEGALRSP